VCLAEENMVFRCEEKRGRAEHKLKVETRCRESKIYVFLWEKSIAERLRCDGKRGYVENELKVNLSMESKYIVSIRKFKNSVVLSCHAKRGYAED